MARRPVEPPRIKRVTTVAGKPMRLPSQQEMHERRLFVRQLHAAGMHPSEIVDQAIRPQQRRDADGNQVIAPPKFDCSEQAIRSLITEIRAELQRELEVFAPTDRAAALARLYGDLVRLRSELQQMRGVPKKDWSAIRGHMGEVRHMENLIADFEGTKKPLKIEHSGELSVNMTRAIGGMTQEQIDEALREEQQKLRDTRSITVHAELAEGEAKKAADPHPELPGGHALQAPDPPGVLHSAPEAAAPTRRERSSDLAARREIRSPFEQDVGQGTGAGRGVSRPVAR